MSSNRRPWYKWWPKDFIVDEKVQCLSPIAELIYRRALDVMWQANACQLPNVCQSLTNAFGKGLSQNEFEKAWSEIQKQEYELFKITEDGKWIYSKRLMEEMKECENISKIRTGLGKKGAKAKAKAIAKAKANGLPKQTSSDTDTDSDTDKELTLKGTYVPPTKDEIENESAVKLKKDLQAASKEIYDKNIFPKVNAWVNTMRKSGKNDRAILHTLLRCIMKPPKESCWAYCTKIINIEDGNFNERDHQKTA